jgi:hypothetical protein
MFVGYRLQPLNKVEHYGQSAMDWMLQMLRMLQLLPSPLFEDHLLSHRSPKQRLLASFGG